MQEQKYLKKEIPEEYVFLKELEKSKFGQHLNKLCKKLQDKKIIIYGAGLFFKTINEYYDLSRLNIIGVSDKKFDENDNIKEFEGYKTIKPDDIEDFNPDYILIGTRYCLSLGIFLNMKFENKIKIKPLVKKTFIQLIIGG